VADRKDPDEPCFAIDFIDEAKSSHLVFPGHLGSTIGRESVLQVRSASGD